MVNDRLLIVKGGSLARHIIVGRLFPLIVCLLTIITFASAEGRKSASDPGKIVITDEDIKKMKKMIEDILAQEAFCVYGNEEKIESQKKLFKKTFHLSK